MVRIFSHTRRPTPVALSNTMREGTPPANLNTVRSPWQTHSAFSPGKTWAMPMFEQGNVSTK